jgi:hypothetical protein
MQTLSNQLQQARSLHVIHPIMQMFPPVAVGAAGSLPHRSSLPLLARAYSPRKHHQLFFSVSQWSLTRGRLVKKGHHVNVS